MPTVSAGLRDKVSKIEFLVEKKREIEQQLHNLIVGEPDKPVRKVNEYSISELVIDILSDKKPRKAKQIADDIRVKTGHTPTPAAARSAAKYLVTRGKLLMDERTKEFMAV